MRKEKLSRYTKKIMAVLSAFVVLVGGVCLTSFDSKAGGDVFYLDYAQPTTSESQGYLSLMIQNDSTSELKVVTWFWSCYAVDSGIQSPAEMMITLSNDRTVTFNVTQYGATGVWYTVNYITTVGMYRMYKHTSSESYTYDYTNDNYTIRGWKVGGNGCVSGPYYYSDFNVYFSEDGEAILLQEIIELLTSSNSIDSSILSTVSSILNSVDGVENQLSSVVSYLSSVSSKLTSIQTQLNTLITNTEDLLSEQKESNTWLEKILNELKKINEVEGEHTEEDKEVDGSKVDDLTKAEDELFADTSDYEQSLEITLNNAFGVIVDLVEKFVTVDNRVFVFVITMLTLGTLALILGR